MAKKKFVNAYILERMAANDQFGAYMEKTDTSGEIISDWSYKQTSFSTRFEPALIDEALSQLKVMQKKEDSADAFRWLSSTCFTS